jgi:hypothetical protein
VKLPDNFYHHSPDLHLAFICIDHDRCDLVTVDAPTSGRLGIWLPRT